MTATTVRLVTCRRCTVTTRHRGRGLCHQCYQTLDRRLKRGTSDELFDYPRLFRRNEDVIEDWQLLTKQGHTKRQAANRMGMSFTALERAICRWRQREREAANT